MKPIIRLLPGLAALVLCLGGGTRALAAAPIGPANPPAIAAAAPPVAAERASAGDLAAAARTTQEGADTGTAADRSEAALERLAALPPEGQLPAGKWVAGTNYQVLLPAQPTDVAPGKVEVIEFFWYGCPHCYALDPYLQSWLKNKPAYVDFKRVHVTWNEATRAHARLFYTLQALGKVDALHGKVFEEYHEAHDPMFVPGDEKATLAQQQRFAKANGIGEADFANAWNSFGVQTNVQKADEMSRRYKVQGVPTVVIDGKYVTDVGMAGNQQNVIQIINDLAASERHH
ncbi:MAG TPA: thiol:disulfide interchange protein DsbA/DsbL [Steroidobacteraceae bacterium]|nr:thiol:disulfide interchange protein DsbA/DsbL [Steroidobacteraceae bacterium]